MVNGGIEMHEKVAVEKNLQNVKEYFEHKNFQVDVFSDYEFNTIGHVTKYDAIIISGGKQNYPDFGKCYDDTPVINSQGMTPEDIYNKIV
jgi:hypothetical protein